MKMLERARLSGRRRALTTTGALLGVATLVTAATFTDSSFLSIDGGNGFGGAATELVVEVKEGNVDDLSDDGAWRVFPSVGDAGGLPIEGSDMLVPGGSAVTVDIPVRNASERLDASISLGLLSDTDVVDTAPALWATGPDGAPTTVGAANAAYLDALRFDVSVDGSTVATGLTHAAVSGEPVPLRSLAAQEVTLVTIAMSLVADESQAQHNGGQALVLARVTATS